MIVSHRYRFIFINPAGTGGSRVGAALSRWVDSGDCVIGYGEDGMNREIAEKTKGPGGLLKHMSLAEALSRLPRECDSYFAFITVRDPWERAYSLYISSEPPGTGADEPSADKAGRFLSFLKSRAFAGERSCWEMARCEGRAGEVYPVRHERAAQDFAHIGRHLLGNAVPLAQETDIVHEDYRKAFTEPGLVRVAHHWNSDVARFGYRFAP